MHGPMQVKLLVTGYWQFYLDRSSIPDAEDIMFFRRVGKQSPNYSVSHCCKNLKSGTVDCISYTLTLRRLMSYIYIWSTHS